MAIDERFLSRMRAILGDEYDAFAASLTEEAVRAVHMNAIKCTEYSPADIPNAVLDAIPYVENGYIVSSGGEGLGNTPAHHSGMFYIQDPGAMSTVSALPKMSGNLKIIDLCAAPGGKTSQLAELISDGGFLLSNEYVKKRAQILIGNIERMGIQSSAVTSLDTAQLAEIMSDIFDIVLADVPCSGEGMFRKGDIAISEWSPENVKLCAERQAEILDAAASLTRNGGYLLYSTCTYSLEENEAQIDVFLDTHADFSVCKIENEALLNATSCGIVPEGSTRTELTYARRFYPHKSLGEGQFFCLMQREGNSDRQPNMHNDRSPKLTRDEERIVNDFVRTNLTDLPEGRFINHRGMIRFLPSGVPYIAEALTLGVTVGEIRGKLLFPHHQLFMAYADRFKRCYELSEAEARQYIAGEEIKSSNINAGYCAMLYRGLSIGGGKASGGVIKNHYPKGLRIHKIH